MFDLLGVNLAQSRQGALHPATESIVMDCRDNQRVFCVEFVREGCVEVHERQQINCAGSLARKGVSAIFRQHEGLAV